MRIALRSWIASADQAALTWIELGRPFPLPRLVASFLPLLSAALDSIAVLDLSVDLSAARASIKAEDAGAARAVAREALRKPVARPASR